MNERLEILNEALNLTQGDRNKTYGSFVDNMQCFAELQDWYRKWAKDKHTIAHNAAMDMVLCKLARIATGASFHRDNYTDAVNYIAAAYECELIGVTRVVKPFNGKIYVCPSCLLVMKQRWDYIEAWYCEKCLQTWAEIKDGQGLQSLSDAPPMKKPIDEKANLDPLKVMTEKQFDRATKDWEAERKKYHMTLGELAAEEWEAERKKYHMTLGELAAEEYDLR